MNIFTYLGTRFKKVIGVGLLVLGVALSIGALSASVPGWAIVGAVLALIGLLVAYTEWGKGSLALVIVIGIAGCGIAKADKPDWFRDQEHTSDKIAISATKAVPYPLAVVQNGGFLERRNQVEKLKRFSDRNKIGYVYLISFGKLVGYWTIKGKVSAVNSQLTNQTQTWSMCSGCGDFGAESIGDDGTWGTNEGGDAGKFFFTTQGTMVVTDEHIVYSDQPLSINVPNLVN